MLACFHFCVINALDKPQGEPFHTLWPLCLWQHSSVTLLVVDAEGPAALLYQSNIHQQFNFETALVVVREEVSCLWFLAMSLDIPPKLHLKLHVRFRGHACQPLTCPNASMSHHQDEQQHACKQSNDGTSLLLRSSLAQGFWCGGGTQNHATP